MKNDNIIAQKSFEFATRIVNLRKYFCYEADNKEFDISRQLLRSGVSIGANIEEAIGAQSDADFLAKLTIAYKEARESHYWIRLLYATNYLTNDMFESLIADIDEICKIIGSIQISTKKRLTAKNTRNS